MEKTIKEIDEDFATLLQRRSVAYICDKIFEAANFVWDREDTAERLTLGKILHPGQKREILAIAGKDILLFRRLEKFKISQKSVAMLCGVTPITVRRWEKGITPLPKLAEDKILKLLQIFED